MASSSHSQSEIFTPGEELAIYDIIWRTPRDSDGAIGGFYRQTITFNKIGHSTPATAPTQSASIVTSAHAPEHPDNVAMSGPDPTYTCIFHYGSYNIVFNCEAWNVAETVFQNFAPLAWNLAVEEELSRDSVKFEFVNVKDDNGFPFLSFVVDCGDSGFIDGWAKRRGDDVVEDSLGNEHAPFTLEEKYRLRKYGDKGIYFGVEAGIESGEDTDEEVQKLLKQMDEKEDEGEEHERNEYEGEGDSTGDDSEELMD